MFKAPRLLFLIFAVILACVYASAGNDSNAIQPIPKKPAAVIKKVEVKPVIINKLQIAIDDWVRLNTGDYGIGVREITGPKRTASY